MTHVIYDEGQKKWHVIFLTMMVMIMTSEELCHSRLALCQRSPWHIWHDSSFDNDVSWITSQPISHASQAAMTHMTHLTTHRSRGELSWGFECSGNTLLGAQADCRCRELRAMKVRIGDGTNPCLHNHSFRGSWNTGVIKRRTDSLSKEKIIIYQ